MAQLFWDSTDSLREQNVIAMNTLFLSPAQSLMLDHVMAWGSLRIGEIKTDPFATSSSRSSPGPFRSRESTTTLMLPSARIVRYLDRVKSHETGLLKTLGIDANDLEADLAKSDGSQSLSNYLWARRLPWVVGGLGDMAHIALDDLSQMRKARAQVLERVERWKRNFGNGESMDSRPNVPGFENNLRWLQDIYETRHLFAQQLIDRSGHGWDLVQAFYSSSERAAQNILEGAKAVDQYRYRPPSAT